MSFFPPTYSRANHRTRRATFSPSSTVASAKANSWNVTIKTTAPGQVFRIVLAGSGATPQMVIDWGDGKVEVHTTIGTKSHTYYLVKTYVIKIQGVFKASGQIKIASFNGQLITKTGAIPPIPGFISISEGFRDATNLETVPDDLLHYNPQITTVTSAFYNCNKLKTIPNNLFQYSGNLTDFQETFRDCATIQTIPETLFKFSPLVAANAFYTTFYNCTALSTIPADLFRYNTLVSTNGFRATFSLCSKLASIPTDLFRYNTLVGTDGFRGVFQYCSLLSSLPDDLFRYNTNAGNNAFLRAFYSCTALTTLPTDLFRYNVSVAGTDGAFSETFGTCSALATVGDDLFRYNVLAVTKGFNGTFSGCVKLQQKANMFFGAGEESTRFLNQSVDFKDCFKITSSFTGVTGTAPALWSCTFGTGTPVKTDCWQGHSVSSVSNFASIPVEWV